MPSVDIFLPHYTEPFPLYAQTVRAALALRYPRPCRIYCLDDGSQDLDLDLKKLVAEAEAADASGPRHSCQYVRRIPAGRYGKAGNLNHGLAQSSAPLILVLDADMVADPQLLMRTVPYFLHQGGHQGANAVAQPALSDTLAFVQTPQVFYNSDQWLVKAMDGPQSLFYKLLCPALDGLGAAPMLGTNYVCQRKAVTDVGGWVQGLSTEDVQTSLLMHAAGWSSRYAPTPLAQGLSPRTLPELFQQRLRWAAGSAQLLLTQQGWRRKPSGASIPGGHAWAARAVSAPGLRAGQRLAYVTSHYYFLVFLVYLASLLVQWALWAALAFVTAQPRAILAWRMQLLLWAPLLVYLLLLPVVPLLDKVSSLVSFVCYLPVYALVTWRAVTRQLRPGSPGARFKASCESYGSGFPVIAWASLALWGAVCALVAIIIYSQASRGMLDIIGLLSVLLLLMWATLTSWPILFVAGTQFIRYLVVHPIQRCLALRLQTSPCLTEGENPKVQVFVS
eukprot:jgi/Mesvir1/3906/Mv19850-RA.2